VTFQEAVQTVLTKKYADFSGRARRSEYWWYALAVIIASVVLDIIGAVIGTSILTYVFALALLVPNIAVVVRRLHDTGRSGWWILLAFIPLIGAIILIVWACTDSQPGDNQYGPSPKGIQGSYNPGATPTWN
jgi:uncharacterized membrane protein YhaH (DUF805 family)